MYFRIAPFGDEDVVAVVIAVAVVDGMDVDVGGECAMTDRPDGAVNFEE